MTDRPQLLSLGLWEHYERIFVRLLKQALGDLADCSPDEHELDLNRLLYKAIVRVSHGLSQDVEGLPAVVPGAPNPPAAADRERTERESKIPDFLWTFTDPHTDDPGDSSKQFVVECKRLTAPPSRFAREYVIAGIDRFRKRSHEYGKGMPSGAMVGYLQRIEVDDALVRINAHSTKRGILPLNVQYRDGETSVELEHSITRSIPQSPIRVIHVWARTMNV